MAREIRRLTEADKWRQDPISVIPIALGSRWGELVAPFVLLRPISSRSRTARTESRGIHRCLRRGEKLTAAVAVIRRLVVVAAEGSVTDTIRTPEQAQIGIFWGYDGTPGAGYAATTV